MKSGDWASADWASADRNCRCILENKLCSHPSYEVKVTWDDEGHYLGTITRVLVKVGWA